MTPKMDISCSKAMLGRGAQRWLIALCAAFLAASLCLPVPAQTDAGARTAEDALALTQAERAVVQHRLAALGFDVGPADGIFGPRTRRAIRDWQSSLGNTATGFLDAEAAAVLIAVVVYPRNLNHKLRIASDFHSWTGVNGGPRKAIHQGIDIVGRSGQPIIAIADGRVVETHVEKCWGPTVVIDHGRDKHGKRLIALYGHVGKILVREGQAVSRGDLVARLGDNHRRFKCMFEVRHLHLQLGRIRRHSKGNAWGHAYFLVDSFDGVNPHLLWANGPNRVTCFDKDRNYPRGTLTYPVPCR